MSEKFPKISSTSFYSNEVSVIERSINSNNKTLNRNGKLEEYYEIEKTIDFILKNNYKRIALQFPDSLLNDASTVATLLEKFTKQKIYILADTSFGDCCVDEVAAEHILADLIIHYGRACLTPTRRLPVIYVFGKNSINIDDCVSKFCKYIPNKEDPILIFYDVVYYHSVANIRQLLHSHNYLNCVISDLQVNPNTPRNFKSNSNSNINLTDTNNNNNNRFKYFCGRIFELDEKFAIEKYKIFYIGSEGITLNNLIMTFNRCEIYSYDPETCEMRKEGVQVNRSLAKRFALIEKAKEVSLFGILIGTLSIANSLDILEHIKNILRKAQKEYHIFMMGKINVTKLANFPEIEMFVIIACPETSLLDAKEFMKPIITPFELEIALVKGKEWSSIYTTDFNDILKQKSDSNVARDEENEESDVIMSLFTQSIKRNPKATLPCDLAKDNHNESQSSKELSTTTLPLASQAFLQRHYRGLERQPDFTSSGCLAVEGKIGVAASYEDENSYAVQNRREFEQK